MINVGIIGSGFIVPEFIKATSMVKGYKYVGIASPVEDQLKALKENAFKKSTLPVILSIENHCDTAHQKIMARKFKEIFTSFTPPVKVQWSKTQNSLFSSVPPVPTRSLFPTIALTKAHLSLIPTGNTPAIR